MKHFSILWPMKNDIRFEYDSWKSVWFCFVSIILFNAVIMLRGFDFKSHWNALIFFDEKWYVVRFRSSRPEVFCKKGGLRNFEKFTEKHLWKSFFFNKVAGLRPATLLKRRPWRRCFPVKFVKFLRPPYLREHLQWLLLHIWTCPMKKYLILFHFHGLSSL